MLSIDEYIKLVLNDPADKCIKGLDTFDDALLEYRNTQPKTLDGFKAFIEKVERLRDAIDKTELTLSADVVYGAIMCDVVKEQDSALDAVDAKFDEVLNQMDTLQSQIEAENKAHNDALRNQSQVDNQDYVVLESKRQELLQYSDKIIDICAQYGITTTDVAVDESMVTIDSLSSLYDEYLKFLQKDESGSNIITKFRNFVSNIWIQGIIVLFLFILCFTPVLDFLSIAFFILLVMNQLSAVKKVKYYSLLMGITFNIQPTNMGYSSLDESLLLPEELTPEMVETDPRFAPLLERLDTLESTDSSKAITQNDELHGRIHAEFGAKRPAIEESIKEYLMIYNNKRRAIIGEVNAYCEYLQGCYADMVRNYRFIGERFSKSLVLDTNFTFGIKKDWIEEKLNIGTGNLIIRPSTDNSKMERFLQTLIINAFSNVMPGKCSIEVYDPNNMAKSVMPLFTQELSEYLTSNYSDLNKSLSDLREYAQQNLKLMAGRTISEYNTIAEREGITPIQYKILLILSQPKTVEETEEINKFFDYSADTGVLLWIISQDMTSPNATIIRKPFDGIQYPIFDYSNPNWEELCLAVTARPEKAKPSKGGLTAEEVEEKFIADFQKGVEKLVGLGKEEISDRMCRKISENVVNAISKAKPAGLPWVEFIENVIPDSMMWKATADNFMNLYPGYENGDPNKYKPYEIGNTGNVHVLGVGGTGAGKSVFLNHLIATISQEYSPKEVELWLCDFKGTEFKFYLPRAETNWKMLPHIKACLCTSDGDYATSLFKALRDEADLRYEILKTPEMYRHLIPYIKTDADVPSGFKGTKDWNVYWRRKAAETGDDGYLKNIFPRILFICDEFQVIFEKAEPNNLEKIKADITQIAKVGRAANVHIFFTSQSMNKTLSPDILQQFTLRFALRCDKEVSMQILGTNKAGEIKERFGFLYVSATGIEKEKQPKYKTPYFRNDDEQFRQIIKCAERAEAEGIPPKDIITYEEATKHPIKEMTDLYKKPEFQKVIPDSGVFLLGNRMAYSSNKAPDNIILPAQNDTNILSCFSDYTDFAMFFNQIVTNINCNRNPGQLMINSQVTELSDLVLPEKYITDKPVFTSRMTPKTTPKEFLEAVEKIYLNRKEKKVTDSPLWIICLGWEKGKGIGIEKDAMLSVKFQTLIKTIGEFNMHFILINSSMAGFPVTVAELFKYRIAGKCTTEDSIALIKTKQAGLNYDLKTGWLFSHHDGVTTRDKLYISEVEGKVEQLEIVL